MQNSNLKETHNSAAFPFRPAHHRRAHSEVNFRLSEDLDLGPHTFDANVRSSFEEMAKEDDLFTFVDAEELGGSISNTNLSISSENAGGAGGEDGDGGKSLAENSRPRHRFANRWIVRV